MVASESASSERKIQERSLSMTPENLTWPSSPPERQRKSNLLMTVTGRQPPVHMNHQLPLNHQTHHHHHHSPMDAPSHSHLNNNVVAIATPPPSVHTSSNHHMHTRQLYPPPPERSFSEPHNHHQLERRHSREIPHPPSQLNREIDFPRTPFPPRHPRDHEYDPSPFPPPPKHMRRASDIPNHNLNLHEQDVHAHRRISQHHRLSVGHERGFTPSGHALSFMRSHYRERENLHRQHSYSYH